MSYSMQLAPGYRLSPFPTESLRWRCSLDPPLPIERSGRWAWRVLVQAYNRAGKEKKQMIPLLKLAIEAHGGLERWRQVHGIDLKLTIGGGLWEFKGLPQGLVGVALHVEPADRLVTITPFGPEGAAGYFTPDRVWIQKPRGDVLQERSAPLRSFDGHTLTTPWDKLHELYFVSYAFLNYLSTPFLFAEPGFEVAEGKPYLGAGEKWRKLNVKYPAAYPTHSRDKPSISTKRDCCIYI